MALYDVSTSEKKASPALIAGATNFSEMPVGSILPYGGSTPPSGYLLCDGTAVSRTTYSELFAVIGTSFGAGDGSTTFNLPDMRGKFAEGIPSNGTLGESKSAGLPNITGALNTELQGKSYYGTRSPSGALDSRSTVNVDIPLNSGTQSAGQGLSFDASKSNSIYGNSDTVQPPAVCVNYIIKARQVGVPADFASHIEDVVNEMTTSEVTSGSTAPVTSGGVYDTTIAKVESRKISFTTTTTLSTAYTFTAPKNGVYRITATAQWNNGIPQEIKIGNSPSVTGQSYSNLTAVWMYPMRSGATVDIQTRYDGTSDNDLFVIVERISDNI